MIGIGQLARTLLLATVALSIATTQVRAQGVDGHISLLADVLPAVEQRDSGPQAFAELRARLFAERRFEVGERVTFTVAGFAEGLLADRATGEMRSAAIVRPQELHVEIDWAKADLRVGLSRVVWGRLDEFLPTDVVNPQDLARFFLEGRTEGRMPVGMVRARWLPSDRFTVEGIYVPVFRRGRFDQLEESTSPFNLAPPASCPAGRSVQCQPFTRTTDEPARGWEGAQGGSRINVTSGRVDWSASAYRGFEPLPVYELLFPTAPLLAAGAAPVLNERFPRFTMIGGDFETARGELGLRGEVAAFVDRTLQAIDSPTLVRGKAIEAGIGVDRKAGAYRVSGNVVLSKRWGDAGDIAPEIDRTDVTLVVSIDRSFARETRTLRTFGVYNPGEESVFVRVIATFSVRDNVSFEISGGLFTGDGVDALSRLATRDFLYSRLKVFF